MCLLTRYIARQMALSVALALLLIASFIWALQAMRLGHHLVGSGLGPRGVALIFAYTLPTLTAFAIPLATVAAMVLVHARLHAGGEIEAMAACGASPRHLAKGPALVIVASAVVALFASAFVEGPALARLQRLLSGAVCRAEIHRIPSGVFHRLSSKTTLHIGQVAPGPGDSVTLSRVFVASQNPDRLLLASSGSIRMEGPGDVMLDLRHGEAHQPMEHHATLRARFQRLLIPLPLGEQFERHFGFLTRAAADTTPLAAAAACLALGLLTVVIIGWLGRPILCLGATIALVGAHQAMLWLGHALWVDQSLAIWLDCALAMGAAVLIVVRGR